MSAMIRGISMSLLMMAAINGAAKECQSNRQCTHDYERLEAVTSDGMLIKGIAYRKQRLTDRYIARFRKGDEFMIMDSSGKAVTGLSSEQFVSALEDTIVRIHKRGGRLDKVTLDFDTVEDTWSDIRVPVRKAVESGKGPLQHKDEASTQALRGAIRRSKLVRMTCEMVRRHHMACDPRDMFTEQITFQNKYVSGDRRKAAPAEDVGMSEVLGFSISFIENKD